jgi:hypothetical protein
MSGLGPVGMLSRRPSCQVGHADLGSGPSRQSSIMSMVSLALMELARPWLSVVQAECKASSVHVPSWGTKACTLPDVW